MTTPEKARIAQLALRTIETAAAGFEEPGQRAAANVALHRLSFTIMTNMAQKMPSELLVAILAEIHMQTWRDALKEKCR